VPDNRPLDPDLLPSVAHIPWRRLDPRYPRVVLLSSLLSWLVAGIAGAVFVTLELLPLTWLGFAIIWGLLLVPAAMAWPTARVKRYAIREDDVLFREGLLWQSMTALPRSRIQHIETESGPIERALGLITLKCYGAGGHQADLVIPGLDTDLGHRLRQHLLDLNENTPEPEVIDNV